MILKFFATALSTLGVGKIPWAPGTWGSLVGVLLWWFFMPSEALHQFNWILLLFLVGWIATYFYEKLSQKHDPKEVVIDEVIGMWITLFAVPANPNFVVLAFLLFRLFDIWKPFPIGWIDQKVPGAIGTILDDVAAGFAARISLWGVIALGGIFGVFS